MIKNTPATTAAFLAEFISTTPLPWPAGPAGRPPPCGVRRTPWRYGKVYAVHSSSGGIPAAAGVREDDRHGSAGGGRAPRPAEQGPCAARGRGPRRRDRD